MRRSVRSALRLRSPRSPTHRLSRTASHDSRGTGPLTGLGPVNGVLPVNGVGTPSTGVAVNGVAGPSTGKTRGKTPLTDPPTNPVNWLYPVDGPSPPTPLTGKTPLTPPPDPVDGLYLVDGPSDPVDGQNPVDAPPRPR